MKIFIKTVQIHNFRSIKFANIELNPSVNLFIGKNNCGKSNILRAIDIGLSPRNSCGQDDFYRENLSDSFENKEIYIDIRFAPLNDANEQLNSFDNFWSGVFLTQYLKTDINDGNQYAMIRTIIRYDATKRQFVTERKPINIWKEEGNIPQTTTALLNSSFFDYVQSFYEGALRNFAEEKKDKKSYFARATNDSQISAENISEIENDLSDINAKIIGYSPNIKTTQDSLQDIAKTLGRNGGAKIESVPRSFKDLHRGMSITISDNGNSFFDIENCGTGINSWISFLSLVAYVKQRKSQLIDAKKTSSSLFVACLEEPEAFLHPQAQKQLLNMILEFEGQLFISSHSQSIVSQIGLDNIYYVSKNNTFSEIKRLSSSLELSKEEKRVLNRVILKTKGELLFSNCVILCEGVSDAEMINIFFNHYFSHNPDYYAINIVQVNGQQYQPFVKLFNGLGIKYYIFADGENSAINKLKNLANDIIKQDYSSLINKVFFVHENGDNLERSLIREGYYYEIVKAIDVVNGEVDYFKSALDKNPISREQKKKTGLICRECGMDISIIESLPLIDGFSKEQDDLYQFLCRKGGKTLYCEEIANQIIMSETKNKIPALFDKMFYTIKKDIE